MFEKIKTISGKVHLDRSWLWDQVKIFQNFKAFFPVEEGLNLFCIASSLE